MIAAKVANALALDYPRERLELIVASDGSTDATAERARAAGADLVLELPPRRQGRRPERRRRAGRRRDPRLLRRQQRLGAATRCAASSRPSPTPTVGYVCGQVRFLDAERRQPRGRLLALRDGGAGDGVGAGRGHRRQRRDLRGRAATPTSRSPPPAATTSRFPFALAKRGLRSLYAPGARAEEKMVPTIEGEFARKRRMMVGLWDIVVGEGMLSPARLPAALRLRARLAPAAALPDPVPAPGRPRRQRSPCSATAGSTSSPSPSSSPCSPPPCSAASLPLAPFRIARYYALTTASIAAGLWDRLRRGAAAAAGRRPREPADAARLRHRSSPRSPWRSSRRSCWSRRSRSSSAAAARSSTASAASASAAASSRC